MFISFQDMRIHKFSLKFTPKNQKKFVSVFEKFAFPSKDTLLFAYEYGRNNALTGTWNYCQVK